MDCLDAHDFLLANIDILATAAGYTTNEFLFKTHINPTSLWRYRTNGIPLKDWMVDNIRNYIYSTEDPWLIDTYELAIQMDLPRSEICRFSTGPLKDPTRRSIMCTNLRAFRYFFYINIYDIAKNTGYSKDTIYSIENGNRCHKNNTYEDLYLYVKDRADMMSSNSRSIFKMGNKYEILTKIPKLARF